MTLTILASAERVIQMLNKSTAGTLSLLGPLTLENKSQLKIELKLAWLLTTQEPRNYKTTKLNTKLPPSFLLTKQSPKNRLPSTKLSSK